MVFFSLISSTFAASFCGAGGPWIHEGHGPVPIPVVRSPHLTLPSGENWPTRRRINRGSHDRRRSVFPSFSLSGEGE